MNTIFKAPKFRSVDVKLRDPKQAAELQLYATIQAGFCLLIADDMMVDLYNGEDSRKYLSRPLLLDAKKSVSSLWRSFKCNNEEFRNTYMMIVGDVMDEYIEKLHTLYNDLRVSYNDWNSSVVKFYIANYFLYTGSETISMAYRAPNRHFIHALEELNKLSEDSVKPLLRQHGKLNDVLNNNFDEPLNKFISKELAPAVIKIVKELSKNKD